MRAPAAGQCLAWPWPCAGCLHAAGQLPRAWLAACDPHRRMLQRSRCCVLQALLAAVEAGPGSSAQPSQEDAVLEADWRDGCGTVVGLLDDMIDLAGLGAGSLQQLAQLGVWQQLEQLVAATGALRPAGVPV